MSNVVKGTREPRRLRAALNLTMGCVLLGGCSSGSDRFSSASFGSGYGAESRVSQAAAPSSRIAANTPQPAQPRGLLPSAACGVSGTACCLPASQPASGYQLASATPGQASGYMQASRVDLPPLQERQPSQGTKMADGYGRYNQPPLPDGTYTGPRASTPYDDAPRRRCAPRNCLYA